jgi:hypothetical protein
MSADNDPLSDFDAEAEIEDAEGLADRERKKDIIENRRKCEETAEYLFSRVSQGQIHPHAAARSFKEPVRSYLMSIEPLLKSSDLPYAEQAWLDEKMGVVEFPLPPRFQGLGGRPDEKEIKRRGFRLLGDPPEPDSHTIRGLKEIIERDQYTHSWEIQINPIRGMKAKQTARTTHTETIEKPTPKMALFNAIRTADEFLQNAGVGLEVGSGKLDEDQLAPDY